MPDHALVRAAARNNAEWCDAFCRSHGIDGAWHDDFWLSPVRTPPLYSDAVMLSPSTEADELLARIDTRPGCSFKDSFAAIDPAPAGFDPLFRAEWLVLEHASSGRQWSPVTTKEQLREWESAWGDLPDRSGFFRPALLADEAIAFLAGYEGERIVAGAIANRSATVIGLSNVFDSSGDLASAWAAGAAAATERWGPLPVVGYERDAALDAAHEAGCRSIGELVVWAR